MLRFVVFSTIIYVVIQTTYSASTAKAAKPTISVASPNHVATLGEGPYYSTSEQALYYVDTVGSDYIRLDTKTGTTTKRNMNGTLVSMIIPYQNEPGNFIVSRRHQLLKLNWATGSTTVVATVSPSLNGRERFNDAKCDPKGRLFIGTVLEDEKGGVIPNGGALYRLDGNKFTKVAQGFSISNGMSWSNNGAKEMYFNDSEGRKIYIFKYDLKTGNVSNQRVLIDVAKHQDFVADEYPDGMAIDTEGYIWVAMWNGGRVVKINTSTARVIDQINVSSNAKIPTSLAFGDYQGRSGFYLTTASIGLAEKDRFDGGKVLHIDIDKVKGGRIGGYIPSNK